MEEQVGALWHRVITRWADSSYPQAGVRLDEIQRSVGVLFRALGGDGGLQVETTEATEHGARRSWLQRIAGSNDSIELAWRDERSLRLPGSVDCFPLRDLNRELYLWLAVLAVADDGSARRQLSDWLVHNQALVRTTLERYPGMRDRYRRLVDAHLAQRPRPERLPAAEAEREGAIRRALQQPGSVTAIAELRRAAAPVPLWLHPSPPRSVSAAPALSEDHSNETPSQQPTRDVEDMARRRAGRVDEPEPDRGLITVRMENIFTWGEHVNVDRGSEDEEDPERAEAVARDMDEIAVSKDNKTSATRIKFDLDLPSAAEDDSVIGDGIMLPEWDWKRQNLRPNHCRIVSMVAADALPLPLPDHLKRTARQLRNQFLALMPARVWLRGQPDGQEVDIDACLRFASERAAGQAVASDNLYRDLRSGARDLACLLLADLSLSTDSWVNDHHRVIDVIRDSLYLFAESLQATGDRFAMFGFSSRRRDPVRVHTLKNFDEPYNANVRGRLAAIKPGYYTRMGAGIRHASELLKDQPAGRRLLLILTDGKPNDLDQYEGRYGIEDTREAIRAARQLGLQPFCVTIDEKGNDYLPYLFGSGGYVVVRHPAELPKRLPLLYARLTA